MAKNVQAGRFADYARTGKNTVNDAMDGALSQITLEKIKHGCQMKISDYLLDSEVDIVNMISDYMIVRVRGYLLGETARRQEVTHPKDWWQAFKSRWFPEWARKKWPVVNRIHVMDAHIIYPELHKEISWPEKDHFVSISKWSMLDGE